MKKITCLSHEFALNSPLLCRFDSHLKKGDTVKSGQILGLAQQNGMYYQVINGKAEGVVAELAITPDKTKVFLHYGQHILTLKPLQSELLQRTSSKSDNETKEVDYLLSPMDGLLYLKPDPQAENFATLGSTLKEGQTLALIEVMKNFYPIKYESSKSVRLIKNLVEDCEAVSMGQKLFEISKD